MAELRDERLFELDEEALRAQDLFPQVEALPPPNPKSPLGPDEQEQESSVGRSIGNPGAPGSRREQR